MSRPLSDVERSEHRLSADTIAVHVDDIGSYFMGDECELEGGRYGVKHRCPDPEAPWPEKGEMMPGALVLFSLAEGQHCVPLIPGAPMIDLAPWRLSDGTLICEPWKPTALCPIDRMKKGGG